MSAPDLATQSCKDCAPGSARLDEAQAAELHQKSMPPGSATPIE